MLLGMNATLAEEHRIGELVNALFSLPFILFSMAGGFLADRFSKRTISVGVKTFEMLVMLLALAGFAWQQKLLSAGVTAPLQTCWPLLGCVFLMGVHSAFFGPSKYGLLPELLPERKLSWGNGLLELGTFTAIIFGTVAAGYMAKDFRGQQWVSGVILIALAVFGFFTSLGIARVPAANPRKKFSANFPGEVWAQIRVWRKDRPLFLAAAGNTYFCFLGALLQLNVFFYGANVLQLDETKISCLFAALAVGIGLGSVAAGYLSGGKIEYGLVPFGAVGLAVFSASLAQSNLSVNAALLRLALLGFAGGFFIVPVSALLQHRPDKTAKGETLAAANLLSFVGIFLASGAHSLMAQALHLNPRQIFLVGGGLTLVSAIYVLWILPDAVLRFGLWLLTRTLYRVRVLGREHIPDKGGALFVCNHVSFVDALLLTASTDRPVRFIMYTGFYELPWVKPIARILGAIPISSTQRPRDLIKSLRTASEAIRAGEVVCIFAVGQVTRIGQLLPFRRGLEKIMQDVEAPIVPVALDGVWGSIFSFEKKRFLWKLPRQIPYPVTVSFGPPMPPGATASEVRQVVQELMASAWSFRRGRMRPLQRAFVLSARRHPFRLAMAGSQSPKVSFGSALMKAIFLARRLKTVWAGQEKVGLLLPPSVPGALVNFAAMLLGKVPVNLSYTLSERALASCIRQCEIKTVVTSKTFLEKVKLTVPCEPVYLEECAAHPRFWEKLAAFFMTWLLPVGWLERALGRGKKVELDDLATVIFSSGSTGEPKGVMLSHYNIVRMRKWLTVQGVNN